MHVHNCYFLPLLPDDHASDSTAVACHCFLLVGALQTALAEQHFSYFNRLLL